MLPCCPNLCGQCPSVPENGLRGKANPGGPRPSRLAPTGPRGQDFLLFPSSQVDRKSPEACLRPASHIFFMPAALGETQAPHRAPAPAGQGTVPSRDPTS